MAASRRTGGWGWRSDKQARDDGLTYNSVSTWCSHTQLTARRSFFVVQVGNLEEAAKAKEACVDGIIVQGREAGGHVIGQEGLLPLLPKVVDLVSDSGIAVIAAGGIVDGRGYAAALAVGAHGVCLGTRFLASEESFAHPLYKKRLIEMNSTDYTNVFGRARWPGAPHRVLKTPFYVQWKNLADQETEENQPIIGHTIIHGVHRDVRRFAGTVPNATTTGDIDSMVMYAGQAVGLITEIIPASEVINRLIDEVQHVIRERFSDCQLRPKPNKDSAWLVDVKRSGQSLSKEFICCM
ncbi:hypothetical protein GUJ93_ZPchr0008g11417 [Zizania palustris]|uniref:Nitronate monooxygenase domain-containing protein n=1 Tax=Zizania palustris TaxID=103762 RepID=A0A8J5UX52_ZIZPA|nr:hypothetical protein GUJ93_ZPchr0008g11417 [Zizania palustris]